MCLTKKGVVNMKNKMAINNDRYCVKCFINDKWRFLNSFRTKKLAENYVDRKLASSTWSKNIELHQVCKD